MEGDKKQHSCAIFLHNLLHARPVQADFARDLAEAHAIRTHGQNIRTELGFAEWMPELPEAPSDKGASTRKKSTQALQIIGPMQFQLLRHGQSWQWPARNRPD